MMADTITSFATAITSAGNAGGIGPAGTTATVGFAALIDAGTVLAAAAPSPACADIQLSAISSQPIAAFEDAATTGVATGSPTEQHPSVITAAAGAGPMIKPAASAVPVGGPVAVISAPTPMAADPAVGAELVPAEASSQAAVAASSDKPGTDVDDEEPRSPLGDAVPSAVPTPAPAPAPAPVMPTTTSQAVVPQNMTVRGSPSTKAAAASDGAEPIEAGAGVIATSVLEQAPDVLATRAFNTGALDKSSARKALEVMPDTSAGIRHVGVDLPATPPPGVSAATPLPASITDATLRLAYPALPATPAATGTLPQANALSGHFGSEIGAIVRRQIAAGREEVTVRLDPAEMGRVHIRFSFDQGGELRAVVATESPAALELLRRDVGQLDRALAQAGVRTDAGSFRFDEGQSGGGFAQPHPGRADRRFAMTGDGDPPVSLHEPIIHRAALPGRVDMLA